MPSPGQRAVLEAIAQRADVLVTMTDSARQRLLSLYNVRESSVVTIPHGATVPSGFGVPDAETPTLLTWGLLGKGQGVD